MFYLYNIKMQGWISRSHNYTSDLADAMKFEEEEMTRRVKLNKSPTGLGVIPVSVEWLENI